ncbi:MAG: hypothetical protein R3227_00495 [Reinekea sp.]|nr:hypothetical protein [Reinekea sp.]
MRRNSPKSNKAAKIPSTVDLKITRFSHDGRGIGHIDGRVVMVSGAVPGEQCTVALEQGNSKLWQGRAVKISHNSEYRSEPLCRLYGQCGGCQQQHLSHATQISLKEQTIRDQMSRQQLIVPELEPALRSEPYGYRHRARFHLSRSGQIGFHAWKGHEVVPVQDCPVLIEPVQLALNALAAKAPVKGVKQVELVVDDYDQIGLAVIEATAVAKQAVETWAREQGWAVEQPLSYRSGAHQVTAAPGEFTQVNRSINERMIVQIAQWLRLTPNDRLVDLFCGNGNISLALSDKVQSVFGVESSVSAIQQANDAKGGKTQARFVVENLFTTPLQDIAGLTEFNANVVILDPPRAGAEAVCQTMDAIVGAERLLYVSCDPATMARDLKHLVNQHWHLRKVGLIDMFPQTRHIETMALLEK